MSFQSFKNISDFRTHSTYISGLKFEGLSGYLGTDTNYFKGKTVVNTGYSSIFTDIITSTNSLYTKDVGDSFSIDSIVWRTQEEGS